MHEQNETFNKETKPIKKQNKNRNRIPAAEECNEWVEEFNNELQCQTQPSIRKNHEFDDRSFEIIQRNKKNKEWKRVK